MVGVLLPLLSSNWVAIQEEPWSPGVDISEGPCHVATALFIFQQQPPPLAHAGLMVGRASYHSQFQKALSIFFGSLNPAILSTKPPYCIFLNYSYVYNIPFPSRTLINEVGRVIPFTVTINLKNYKSITSKVNAKCSDNSTD